MSATRKRLRRWWVCSGLNRRLARLGLIRCPACKGDHFSLFHGSGHEVNGVPCAELRRCSWCRDGSTVCGTVIPSVGLTGTDPPWSEPARRHLRAV